MALHAWTVLCREGKVDEKTNVISLLDVIDSIQVGVPSGTPADAQIFAPAGWNLVTVWSRTNDAVPETVYQRLRILSPKGEDTTQPIEVTVGLQDQVGRARAVAQMPFIIVRGPGTYLFVVEHREPSDAVWIRDAAVPLLVNYVFSDPK